MGIIKKMESLSLFLKLPEVSKVRTSERAEAIRPFVERLKNKQGKSYSPAFIGMKLAHVKTPDLYFLLKKCEQANNFGAMFWYSIK